MDAAINNFRISLSNIENICNKILSEFPQAISDSGIRRNHETQQCGAVVLLTGYFEVFLKDLVKGYAQQISLSQIPYSDLPEKIVKFHYEKGGSVISKVAASIRTGRTPHFEGATATDMVKRLASSETANYQILWEAFADTQSNPGPDVVESIAKNLGITDFWNRLAEQTANKKQWPRTAIIEKLSELIAKRNECAHTGRVSPIPTAHDILDYIDLLTEISNGMRKLFRIELIEMTLK